MKIGGPNMMQSEIAIRIWSQNLFQIIREGPDNMVCCVHRMRKDWCATRPIEKRYEEKR